MKIKILILTIVLSCAAVVAAQDNFVDRTLMSGGDDWVIEFPDSFEIDSVFSQIVRERNPRAQSKLNDSIYAYILSKLNKEAIFAAEFESKRFGRILSSDKKLCIYNWNYFNADDGMVFNMIIQTLDGKIYSALKKRPYVPDIFQSVKFEDWYGALYYKIEQFELSKKDYYLLLGWSKMDPNTQMKIADVMYFKDGEIYFGKPMFTTDSEMFHSRLIFRYDWMVQMSLDYDRRKKCIVFDHLSPMESSYPFEEPRYAPDMSVDGYYKKSKYWKYKEDINIKNY